MRVAVKPLDDGAVAAANADNAAKYSPKPMPGDADYGAFRKDWMDSYVANGGAIEEVPAETQKTRAEETVAKKPDSQAGAVTQCEGSSPKAPPPPKKADNCPCTLSGIDVICSHGRTHKDGLLQVVATNALGDQITVTPSASGDCSEKLTVRASGESGYPKKGPAPSEFRTAGITHTSFTTIGALRNASPVTTNVSAGACSVTVADIEIEAFPSGKAEFKLKIKELIEKYKGFLAYLPINLGGSKQSLTPLSYPKETGFKKKFGEGELATGGAWKEDKDSNLVYFEREWSGACAPLIGTAASFPVYGVPVPSKAQKYIKAGIYLNVSFGVDVGAKCTSVHWPKTDSTEWREFAVEVKGGGSLELAAELLLLSKDALSAKASGKTSAAVTGSGVQTFGESFEIVGVAEFNPLTVTIAFEMAWGLFEYEKSWPFFEKIESDPLKYTFD